VARPCIATPLPALGASPTVFVDAGANAECAPQWLLQFAEMGAAFFVERYGVSRPKVALLSIGEEPSKGNNLVKETHKLLAAAAGGQALYEFVGNVEGRDLLTGDADVIVTDGFTGNVALKTLEGAVGVFMKIIGQVFNASPETKAAGDVLLPELLVRAAPLDPEGTGGAMLLGVNGVCIISHGSSSARAIVNAIGVGHEMAARNLAGKLAAAVAAGPLTASG
jgi:glycerol-3-phosphate acyltransferase PlsX